MTREMVEKRAKELAVINGRLAHEFTEEDRVQAKHEMLGAEDTPENQEEDATASLTQWDEDPDTAGHQVENSAASDEQTVAERLVQEGLDEANHDQMLNGTQVAKEQS